MATWLSVTRRWSGRTRTDIGQGPENSEGNEPERDDGSRAETQRLEARRRQEQGQQGPANDDNDATQGQLHAPAVADPANDVEKVGTMGGPAVAVKHSAFS
jgi:hypothetical protein